MIIWRLLVLLITIQWCSFTVNPSHKIRSYRLIKCWHAMAAGWVTMWDVSIDKHVCMQENQTKPIRSVLYEAHLWKVTFLSWREEVWVPVRLWGDLRAFILSLRLFSVWLNLCCLLFDRGGTAVGFVAVWVAMASCAAQSSWSYHRLDRCLWKHKHRGVHCLEFHNFIFKHICDPGPQKQS